MVISPKTEDLPSSDEVPPASRRSAARRPTAKWVERGARPDDVGPLIEQLGVSRLVAQILVSRGYSDPGQARDFLSPELSGLHDPYLLRGMETAVTRLQKAIHAREAILIYGDYDVDGTTSVVVLKKTIELLGGVAEFHIPNRLTEGYGMRTEIVEHAAGAGIRLIVSVDTGIRAGAVVSQANQLGIDVIVTDHHLPDAELPPALAVLNPNRADCGYPCKHLCGAGVTLKLVQALLLGSSFEERKQEALLDSFLKPVAIATIADIVPLTGENRAIVRRGLAGLRNVRNPGLRALLSVAGLEAGEIPTAYQVAFRVAPRINAAGRMATASDVIELLLTTDAERAQTIAAQLDALNRERQETEREIVEQIVKQCEADEAHLQSAALVFAHPEWHLGVLGIVASRLVERYFRPVFVLGLGPNSADGLPCYTGSGRSIPSFHLLEALESMGHLFTRFGGHRGAAGLTISCDSLSSFRTLLSNYAEKNLTVDQRRPEFIADASVKLRELTDSTVQELLNLGPFGFGNPTPLLLVENVSVGGETRALGSERHISVPVRQGSVGLTVKAWNFGDRADLFTSGSNLDLLVQVEDDPASRKRGYRGWSLSLKDARPHSGVPV